MIFNVLKKIKTSTLLVACVKGDLETVIRIITELPYLINTKSGSSNNSLLIIACKNSHAKIAAYLVQMGADIDLKGDGGLTALHFAINNNMPEIVELLINEGVDIKIKIKDDHGHRAIDLINPNQSEIYNLIKGVVNSGIPEKNKQAVTISNKSQELQGSCDSCKSHFPISINKIEDYMECPNCGEEATIMAICPHCGHYIMTNGGTISCSIPCPDCEREFIWNTFKATDGTPMVVSMTGRLELHDIASAIPMMQQKINKNQHGSD